MIDTNTFVGIAFQLIANFTNVVQVPPENVPVGAGDLVKCVPHQTQAWTLMLLEHRTGTRYWIYGGVVQMYESPGTYFHKSPSIGSERFVGQPVMNSNQVVRLVTTTIERLAKTGNPIANVMPLVEIARPLSDGRMIPFYLFRWGAPNSPIYRQIAQIEVDARSGSIVYVELGLRYLEFFDLQYADYITDTVYTPDPPPGPLPIPRNLFPLPTTNQVQISISNWLIFCQRLGVSPGSDTTFERVDWNQTFLCTNKSLSTKSPICAIRFKNGACFATIDGKATCHFSDDSCYVGVWDERPRKGWELFKGKVIKRWEDLAKDLEQVLIEKLCITKSILAPYSPSPTREPPEMGSQTVNRLVVDWCNWPKNTRHSVSESETKTAFSAEFNLETGELMWINFEDPKFIAAVARAQMKSP